MREMSETAHPTYCRITEDFDWGVVLDVSKALWCVRCQKLPIRHTVTLQKTLIGVWFRMFQRHFDPWDVRNCTSDMLSHPRRLCLEDTIAQQQT